MDKLMYLFFAAWILCGCSIDNMLDDWRACIMAIGSMIVIVVCIYGMTKNSPRGAATPTGAGK